MASHAAEVQELRARIALLEDELQKAKMVRRERIEKMEMEVVATNPYRCAYLG